MDDKGYTVMLVSTTWNGKRSLKARGWSETREGAEQILRQWQAASDADYRVLGPVQLRKLRAEIEAEKAARRRAGQAKAAAKRAKNAAAGRTPRFILCPRCRARSRILFTEMGGLQNRRCSAGHEFTYDKWIADRAFWNPAALLHVYGEPHR
jgi:hypothetical protein